MALVVGAGLLFGPSEEHGARATAIAADFDPGNIISDAVFFNPVALSDDQVQSFLTSRGKSCTAGSMCLKSYTAGTLSEPADGYCQGYTGGLTQSAAQIIGGVARSCGINPQVLLVLLEKEQGLVSATRPSDGAYQAATGYGCPDTSAGCNNAYSGFFYQVYFGARQYQRYAANPGGYRYKAGQVNSIYYNPNYGCGAANVYIANQATAGLYNYTPYVPNAAAMANLYGLGDACSAYGNRNFWRIFTDWFGNPQVGSYLLRSPDNATVYLVSGLTKYPIGDMATVSSLSVLGQVRVVAQQYLDRRTTGQMMSRVVLASTGSVYFIDSGIKLPFATCAQVADYGASCASLVRLEDAQIDAFYSGPFITPVYRTTSGKAFYVAGGQKREIVDDQALAQSGLSTAAVLLQETGLASLPYGPPVSRDGVVLQDRQTGTLLVSSGGGGLTSVPESMRASTALSQLPVRPLDDPSIRQLPAPTSVSSAILRAEGTSTTYLITAQGKKQITAASMLPASPQEASASLLALFPDAGTLDAGTFVKGSSDATVFNLYAGELRPIGAWADLVSLSGTATPAILTIDQRLANLLPTGPTQLGPGTLVVGASSATVYFVNGASELIPVSSFSFTSELGATRLTRVADSAIAAYTVRAGTVTTAIDCGSAQYLGLGGKLYRVNGADVTDAYRLSYMTVDPTACSALPKATSDLTKFLRAADGTIYYMEAGLKRPITSFAGYVALGGSGANTIQVSAFALSQLPTGAPL